METAASIAVQRQASLSVVYNMPTVNYYYVIQTQPPRSQRPKIAMFAIPVLLTLLELNCQCKSGSPFATDPAVMWLAVSCLAAFCLASGLESTLGLARRGSTVLASLCAALLASILAPAMRPVFFTLSGLVSIGQIARSYKTVRRLIDERVVRKLFGRVGRGNLPV